MAHSFPIGISEFCEIREKQLFYVDKTGLISELLGDPAKALSLQRPRRFGKTLNLTMLRCFFDDQADNRALFQDLAIAKDPAAMRHLGAYPTVYLSFKDLKSPHWSECQERLIHLVQQVVGQHWSRVARAGLPEHATAPLQRILESPTLGACKDALSLLTGLLFRISGKRVMVLIDEYDSPIHAGNTHGYRDQIVAFMRDFLSGGLKDNPALEKGVLTGVLRLAKDSIFSGLNNLHVSTLLDEAYSRHFGFTEHEVGELLRDAGLSHHEDSIRRWYNGYRFGSQTLYNPWSILSMLRSPDTPFRAHWVNTASNDLIRDLVIVEQSISLAELSTLLAGEAVVREIDPQVALNDLRPESVWSLLLFSGYLTVRKTMSAPNGLALCIPNQEVRQFFETTLSHWLGSPKHADELVSCLLAEDLSRFATLLAETVAQVLSYHDTAGTDNERVYHVFLAGLLVRLRDSYELLSNREAGFGRFDLALPPARSAARASFSN